MQGTLHKRVIFGSLFTTFVVYSALVYTATPNFTPGISISEPIRQGQLLYQENNCVACHQFYGLGGYMGPDLTNVISTTNSEYARVFTARGSLRMPNFNLQPDEIDALIAYLEFVDASGKFPSEDYEIYWHGAVVEPRR